MGADIVDRYSRAWPALLLRLAVLLATEIGRLGAFGLLRGRRVAAVRGEKVLEFVVLRGGRYARLELLARYEFPGIVNLGLTVEVLVKHHPHQLWLLGIKGHTEVRLGLGGTIDMREVLVVGRVRLVVMLDNFGMAVTEGDVVRRHILSVTFIRLGTYERRL